MNQIKRRITWLDMAKGYGMLFVILAHEGVGIVGTWIYTFHMPLFFLLSGYVFNYKSDFISFFKKKCRSLLLPYFYLGIPMLIFQYLLNWHAGKLSLYSACLMAARFILQRRMWTLWFLACLFFLNILFYFTKKGLKRIFN